MMNGVVKRVMVMMMHNLVIAPMVLWSTDVEFAYNGIKQTTGVAMVL